MDIKIFEKNIKNKNVSIGWIGTGVMGNPMCEHLIDEGYKVYIYTRTKAKAENLISKGAIWCGSSFEVTNNSDIVFTIVSYPADVEEVYFGEKGIFKICEKFKMNDKNNDKNNKKNNEKNNEKNNKSDSKSANIGGKTDNIGKILVDLSTTKPTLAEKIYKKAKESGWTSLDAPVSGGDVGARNATLSIMVGGEKEVFDTVFPLFEIIGKNIVYQGTAGKGQHTKMTNQITIAGTMIGVCEALLYGYKAGLNLETVLQSISKGAAGCWTLDNYAPRILKRDFNPGFFVEHFVKDMEIALDEARKMELSLPGLALVHQLYVALKAMGHRKLGTQSLYLALEKINNLGKN